MSELCDKDIIDKCKMFEKSGFPKFLTKKSKKSLLDFIADFDDDNNIRADKVDGFRELWKDLLNDAITYLKFVDKREYPDGKRKVFTRDKLAFGTDKLFKYFKEYQDFEALLYGADRFYRDHILHVFRVWVLGVWLIEEFGRDIHWDLKFHDPKNKKKCPPPSFDETMAMWCIIALTHDLGYPLDKVKKVKTKINGMMAYFGGSSISESDFQIPTHHHFINDFILKFISSKLVETDERSDSSKQTEKNNLKTAIQSKFYLKFSKSFEKFDHGIISCVVLMKNLIYFLESDFDLSNPFPKYEDARQFYIRREILRAIACHTCTDIYHLHPNTLSFILILADELQTWGRPNFAELKSGRQEIKVIVTKANISIDKIEITFETGEHVEGYFLSICQKWHKWLRSALESCERKFYFCFVMKMKDKKGKKYKYEFTCKLNNQISFYLDGKKKNIKKLYKND